VLGLLKPPREYLITVDHFSIWRRHVAWSRDGKTLRDYLTQRYSSSMVFMSLLLGTELNVLFNSATVTTEMRQSLLEEDMFSVRFWAGIAIIFSAILTLLSLISIYTAWTMASAVSPTNAHCIFRSSIGQYIAELPGRFVVGSIYSFVLWLVLFFFMLLPVGFWSILLGTVVAVLFVHTITAFSAFGRLIMHTGAMGDKRIFEEKYEASLLPQSLHDNLLTLARANLENKTSITRQYKVMCPLDRHYDQEELSEIICERSASSRSTKSETLPYNTSTLQRPTPLANNTSTLQRPTRKRTESLVKFADGFDTSGERFDHDKFAPTPMGKSYAFGDEAPMSALTEWLPAALPGRPPPMPTAATGTTFQNSYNDNTQEAAPPLPVNQNVDPEDASVYERWVNSSLASYSGMTASPVQAQRAIDTNDDNDDKPLLKSGGVVDATRSISVGSSLGGDFDTPSPRARALYYNYEDHEGLTDDERFDLEYGEDILDYSPSPFKSQPDLENEKEEEQGLLVHSRLASQRNKDYDSIANRPNGDRPR
jgi:hypothetical protein